MRAWMRDRSLGIFFVSVFLVSWAGQLVVEWREGIDPEPVERALSLKYRRTR